MKSRSMVPFLPEQAPPPRQNAEAAGLMQRLAGFAADDYILLGIIAVLFFEGSDDYILMAALGYMFIMGLK